MCKIDRKGYDWFCRILCAHSSEDIVLAKCCAPRCYCRCQNVSFALISISVVLFGHDVYLLSHFLLRTQFFWYLWCNYRDWHYRRTADLRIGGEWWMACSYYHYWVKLEVSGADSTSLRGLQRIARLLENDNKLSDFQIVASLAAICWGADTVVTFPSETDWKVPAGFLQVGWECNSTAATNHCLYNGCILNFYLYICRIKV